MANFPKYEDTEALPKTEDLPSYESTQALDEQPRAWDNAITTAQQGLRGLGQGASLGLSDELVGAINAPTGALQGLGKYIGMDMEATPELQAYEQARDVEREANAKAKEESPWAYGIGEVAGGVALPLPVIAGAGLKGAIGAGAAMGAASGVGLGEGVGMEALEEVGSGAAIGAATGGLIKGVGSTVNAVMPTKAKQAFELGKKGVTVGTEAADATLEKEEKAVVDSFVKDLAKGKSSAMDDIEKARKLFLDSDMTVDSEPALKALNKKASLLEKSALPEERAEASKIKTFLDEWETKKVEVPYTKVKQGPEVKGKQGTREKLEYEAARMQDVANREGKPGLFEVTETMINGKPHLAIDKIIEGKDGQVIRKAGKAVLAEDETFTEPGKFKNLGEFVSTMSQPRPKQLSPEDALELRRQLQTAGGFTDAGYKYAAPEAKQAYGKLAEQLPEDYRAANKQGSEFFKLFDKLGLDKESLTTKDVVDEITGEMTKEVVPDRALQAQIENKLRNLGKSSDTGVKARGDVDSFIEDLGKLNPELAEKYTGQFKDIGTRAELGKNKFELNPTAPIQSLKSASVPVANVAGKVAREIENPTGTVKAPIIKAANKVLSFSNPALQTASRIARAAGNNTFADTVDKIVAEQAGSTKRNALIFSLLQHPEYRNMLQTSGE